MKRFWIGAGLLLALVVLGCLTGRKMIAQALPCAETLDRAAELAMAEDWPGAKRAAEQAERSWQENRPFSAAVTNHEPMDEIDALFEQLKIYAARENPERFAAGCVFLAEKLRDLGNSQKLLWWNLL